MRESTQMTQIRQMTTDYILLIKSKYICGHLSYLRLCAINRFDTFIKKQEYLFQERVTVFVLAHYPAESINQ